MPLYEFRCESCENTFESLVRSDRELAEVRCPECAGVEIGRLLSVPARPQSSPALGVPMGGCDPTGPACGAPWCRKPNS